MDVTGRMRGTSKHRLYPNTPALRERIKELMRASGLKSARDVAALSTDGLRHQTVHTLISGTVENVNLSTLQRVARILKIHVDDLLELTVTPTSEPWLMPARFDAVPADMRRATERFLWQMFTMQGTFGE